MFACGDTEVQNTIDVLKTIDLSSWVTPKLTGSMAGMFLGCSGLRTLILPDSTSQTSFGALSEDFRALFALCIQMPSLPFSGNFGLKAKDITRAFYDCRSLTEITLAEPQTVFGKNVEFMPRAFEECSSLKNINLSNLTNSKFKTEMSYEDCLNYDNAIVSFTLPLD